MPGLHFGEFTVGMTFRHPIRRTITKADNVWLGQQIVAELGELVLTETAQWTKIAEAAKIGKE